MKLISPWFIFWTLKKQTTTLLVTAPFKWIYIIYESVVYFYYSFQYSYAFLLFIRMLSLTYAHVISIIYIYFLRWLCVVFCGIIGCCRRTFTDLRLTPFDFECNTI